MPQFALNTPITTDAPTIAVDGATTGVHQFQLVVEDEAGNQSQPAFATVIVTASDVPAVPSNLVLTPASATEVVLTWNRNSDNETSLVIERKTGPGDAYLILSTLPAGANIFTDTSCDPGTAYFYRVSAVNGSGASAPCAEMAVTTPASTNTLPVATKFAAVADSPFSITLTWNDDSDASNRAYLLERADNEITYRIIAYIPGKAGAMSYPDTPIAPNTKYTYRMRLTTTVATCGDYTSPLSATTPPRPVGGPVEPTGLSAVVNSGKSVTLSWTDTNSGGASYIVETAPFSWTGEPIYEEVANTGVGANSYAWVTTPETFYYVRIRAHNESGDSANTPALRIRTASAGTDTPKTYDIGPGQQYPTLGALNWKQLGPGDTVRVHAQPDGKPYREKILISVRGTATSPITITGVADTGGSLPIIDGANATTDHQFNVSWEPLQDMALVLFGTPGGPDTSVGYSPGYLMFSNFEVRNAYQGDPDAPGTPFTYTGFKGDTRTYNYPSGIYLERGDHITIRNCIIHGNHDGIFGAAQGDERNLDAIVLDSNHIYGNGTIKGGQGHNSGDQHHNSYLEGSGIIYQFNQYGPLRTGSLGGGLKDRSDGTVVRFNWLEGGGHLLDLPEAQNHISVALTRPGYYQAFVYGNVFYNGPGGAITPIHYGGDQNNHWYQRKGVLYFYHNTFYMKCDQTGNDRVYYCVVLRLTTPGETVDCRNNIFYVVSNTPGVNATEMDLLPSDGIGYFGINWASPTWNVSQLDVPSTAVAAGKAQIVTEPQNNAGFVDAPGRDLRLLSTSPCVHLGASLPAVLADHPVTFQYVSPHSGKVRSIGNGAPDCGAFDHSE